MNVIFKSNSELSDFCDGHLCEKAHTLYSVWNVKKLRRRLGAVINHEHDDPASLVVIRHIINQTGTIKDADKLDVSSIASEIHLQPQYYRGYS